MENRDHKHTNNLIQETSPYLLQHAHNPVAWYAWNEKTLQLAKEENKLILVSIGYSACHWCHVMEHESFEDEEVAIIMNENFICIKVDREERPDVDQVYMDAVQMISGRGGWPLNCFTLPDGKPFWGGTYFPKEQWTGILNNVVQLFNTQKMKLERQAKDITEGIGKNIFLEGNNDINVFNNDIIETMIEKISKSFDETNGGSKGAPKFPMPNNLLFLTRYYFRTNNQKILNHIQLSLDKMASGGIFDQLGGGFARYSVDDQWHVPHFEKMLYDNAQLISLFSEAYQLTRNELYKRIVEETLQFVEREMTDTNGGFYAALDADSEGVEGKFYVWKKEELEKVFNENADIIFDYFGIDGDAYWEEGNHVLIRNAELSDLSEKYKKTESDISRILLKAKELLLDKRSERVRPGLDDKILTSWNALMIKGYIDAYVALRIPEYIDTAVKSATFLLQNVRQSDGGLYHNYKNEKATIEGFLEDYAFTIEALIAVYQVTFDENWLKEAKQLIEYVINNFFDEKSGMFYFTSKKSKDLIARKIEVTDNVISASNSSIANSLFYMSLLLEKGEYRHMAKKMFLKLESKINQFPSAFSNWGILALNMVYPFYSVVFTGSNSKKMLQELNQSYYPNTVHAGAFEKSELSIFKDRFVDKKTMIYVCTGSECKMPVETLEQTLNQIV